MSVNLSNLKFGSATDKNTCTAASLSMTDFSLSLTIDGKNINLTEQGEVEAILESAKQHNLKSEDDNKFVVEIVLNPLNDISTHRIEA